MFQKFAAIFNQTIFAISAKKPTFWSPPCQVPRGIKRSFAEDRRGHKWVYNINNTARLQSGLTSIKLAFWGEVGKVEQKKSLHWVWNLFWRILQFFFSAHTSFRFSCCVSHAICAPSARIVLSGWVVAPYVWTLLRVRSTGCERVGAGGADGWAKWRCQVIKTINIINNNRVWIRFLYCWWRFCLR